MSASDEGRCVADRYELGELLGRGGMGAVWRAQDLVLQRPVAVKEIAFPPSIPPAEREALRIRLMREARAAARLSHPSVTTVFDVVVEDETPYLVMELVEAPTLTDLVRSDGPLEPRRAAAIGLEVLGALEVAHRAGIVHRDVKPGNIMVPSAGPAKLADFGIASLADDSNITTTGSVLGSPSFIAPEQANSSTSGPPADLWGLGASLYFAVEGVGPFERGQALPTLSAVLRDPPRPMQRAGALAPAIEALLVKDPDQRADAAETRRLLSGAAGGQAPAAATQRLAADFEHTRVLATPPPPPPRRTETVERRPAAAGSGRGGWWVAAGILGLLLLAGLAFAFGGLGSDDPPQVADPQPDASQPADDPEPTEQDPEPTEPEETEPEETEPEETEPEETEPEPTEPEETEPEETEPPDDGSAALPEGWTTFTVAGTGATIGYPGDWQVVERSATATDLQDPDSGSYLRIDYTDEPRDDPVADWQAQSDSFAASHDNYTEVSIEQEDYRDYNAALWEYTYTEGDRQLHAYNLGLVAGDYGYALNFQTREENWEASQDLFESFKDTFSPPT